MRSWARFMATVRIWSAEDLTSALRKSGTMATKMMPAMTMVTSSSIRVKPAGRHLASLRARLVTIVLLQDLLAVWSHVSALMLCVLARTKRASPFHCAQHAIGWIPAPRYLRDQDVLSELTSHRLQLSSEPLQGSRESAGACLVESLCHHLPPPQTYSPPRLGWQWNMCLAGMMTSLHYGASVRQDDEGGDSAGSAAQRQAVNRTAS